MLKKATPILDIQDLNVTFTQYEKGLHRVNLEVIHDLNVQVNPGEVVAVVGSSGSGKSLLAHATLGLLPSNCSACGFIRFCGELLDAKRIAEVRGKGIVLVPQSVTFLDPLEKVGAQVRRERKDKHTVRHQQALFHHYGLDEKTAHLYPFQLSGGMARRVLLAASTMETPSLIIADEPTPGLHLAAAKKAVQYFRDFADQGNGVLLITHDIELSLSVADRIAVFYAGTTLEEALASDFSGIEKLRHPYTKALWRALPQNGFEALPGTQPYSKEMQTSCPFAPRCSHASPECAQNIAMRPVRGGSVRCIKAV